MEGSVLRLIVCPGILRGQLIVKKRKTELALFSDTDWGSVHSLSGLSERPWGNCYSASKEKQNHQVFQSCRERANPCKSSNSYIRK